MTWLRTCPGELQTQVRLEHSQDFVSLLTTGADGTLNPFPKYNFRGSLRPSYPLSPQRLVPDHIPRPDYANDPEGYPASEATRAAFQIQVLKEEEIAKMRVVSRMSREILDLAASHVKPGITTDEIDAVVHEATIARNAYPSPLNYRCFPKSVCTSINEIICHGIPDQHVSVYFDGYHGDVNGTYPVGKISEEDTNLIRTTRECLDASIKMCKPGALFRDIGKVIEPIATANGCSVVRSYTGHGIHKLFHTVPNIPHYAKNKAVGTMRPGMTFTIEPMINLGPSYAADEHWPDKWTCTTSDGNHSAQFEETLLITETGVEILSAAPGTTSVY
ncbi:Methionine aminopeptidase 1 [Tulasnella sp. 332]|nr:Methionine aminopeptidase 1 [Tulasnella sp. 332]